MRETMITVAGNVGGPPTFFEGKEGEGPRLVLSMATTPRFLDRLSGEWRDGNTSWYDVWLRGRMAINAQQSIAKGDAVIVSGTVEFRDWQDGDRSGTKAVISARAFGPDLNKYPVAISRVRVAPGAEDGTTESTGPGGSDASVPPGGNGTVGSPAEEAGYSRVDEDGNPLPDEHADPTAGEDDRSMVSKLVSGL